MLPVTWRDWDRAILALAIWREARGEPDPRLAMRAVAHTIANCARCEEMTIAEMCTHKLYISSLTAPHDPQLGTFPTKTDVQFQLALAIVDNVIGGLDPDPTLSATHYFNPKVVLPSWACRMVKTVSLGNHDFYRG